MRNNCDLIEFTSFIHWRYLLTKKKQIFIRTIQNCIHFQNIMPGKFTKICFDFTPNHACLDIYLMQLNSNCNYNCNSIFQIFYINLLHIFLFCLISLFVPMAIMTVNKHFLRSFLKYFILSLVICRSSIAISLYGYIFSLNLSEWLQQFFYHHLK